MLRVALRFALIILAFSVFHAPHALALDKVWLIGFLDLNHPPTADEPPVNLDRFERGLIHLGYKKGRDYVIEARFADLDRTQLPAMAKDLVERKVDVIVTIGTPTALAAKEATTTIPIVMAGSQAPVENGLVASLAHPGGNITGLTHNPGPEIAGKGVQLLKQAAPQISRLAILVDLGGGVATGYNGALGVQRATAADLNLTLTIHDLSGVKSAEDFDAILAVVMAERADALFVYPDSVTYKHRKALVRFVAEAYQIPTMFQQDFYVDAGGLLSYYTSFGELRRQAAGYVDKVFKGAKPADLPVQQPSRFDFVVNLKTAKLLGLTIPQSVLAFADRIVE